jgi:hypothetical protein
MLLSSAPMAGVQNSTLIECRRTDGRTIAGEMRVACEVVFWVTAVAVIDVSNIYLCGGAQSVSPADVADLSLRAAAHFVGLRDPYYAFCRQRY